MGRSATGSRKSAPIDADLTQVDVHHWQDLNPVLTEALMQLTLGAPQIVYNGGLLTARVRYFDAERRRPGLPPDVAALVETLEADTHGAAPHQSQPLAPTHRDRRGGRVRGTPVPLRRATTFV